MIHPEPSPLAGKQLSIKPGVQKIGGEAIRIEDWWDRVSGGSWMHAHGNRACLEFAARIGLTADPIPTDDEVLYGKIGAYGFLVHVDELDIEQYEAQAAQATA